MAKYWAGALPWRDLDGMTTRDMLFHYRIMERQQAEEEVRNEFLYPKDGKPKALPGPKKMRTLVDARLKEWEEERKK